jgi:class 3 adenylate cyclase
MAQLDAASRSALEATVTVVDKEVVPSVQKMDMGRPTWVRVADVVVVFADLKGSTRFNFDLRTNTVARFYEAYMAQLVQIADCWSPGFIAIQGDGLFAIFSGDMRYERAFVAGMTMLTFVQSKLIPALQGRLTEVPPTGLKIGIASGPVFVKRVGIRARSEPIWAGRPVNWAAKCAQKAEAGQMVVAQDVFARFEKNPLIRTNCRCHNYFFGLGGRTSPWDEDYVRMLPGKQANVRCRSDVWCTQCGDAMAGAILAGQKTWPVGT